MNMEELSRRGIVIVGCGKMGSALLAGWLERGMTPGAVHVLDPNPGEWLRGLTREGLQLNAGLPEAPAIALIAVKPQMMSEALPRLAGFAGGETLFVTVAAGTPISAYQAALGDAAPIVRTMPNTPAAVGQGITALIANDAAGDRGLALAEDLMSAVGETVRLDSEAQMHAVTALSGSGPAYVFHLIEAMTAAGEAEGLSRDLALRLARATVAGAGALAQRSGEEPGQLRSNVTSPGGTTAAALEVLMDDRDGFPPLLRRAMAAARQRSEELAK